MSRDKNKGQANNFKSTKNPSNKNNLKLKMKQIEK